MKKYWKRINKGWIRIHYVLSVIFSIILILSLFPSVGKADDIPAVVVMFILFLLLYFLIVIIIEWIKEGFEKGKTK